MRQTIKLWKVALPFLLLPLLISAYDFALSAGHIAELSFARQVSRFGVFSLAIFMPIAGALGLKWRRRIFSLLALWILNLHVYGSTFGPLLASQECIDGTGHWELCASELIVRVLVYFIHIIATVFFGYILNQRFFPAKDLRFAAKCDD